MDKPLEEAQRRYEEFTQARDSNDFERAREAASETLSAIQRARDDQHIDLLNPLGGLGERVNKVSSDAAWEERIEKEVREYLATADERDSSTEG